MNEQSQIVLPKHEGIPKFHDMSLCVIVRVNVSDPAVNRLVLQMYTIVSGLGGCSSAVCECLSVAHLSRHVHAV